jgi:hypothetical protein
MVYVHKPQAMKQQVIGVGTYHNFLYDYGFIGWEDMIWFIYWKEGTKSREYNQWQKNK